MVPKLRSDGTLPPGVHVATIDEICTAFPPYNEQRGILNDSLRRAIAELQALDTSLLIFVDGSFATAKAEPNDVDLLIVTPDHTERKLTAYLEQVCPVEAVSLDVNVEPDIANRIFDLFTMTRTGRAKGILRLT